MGSSPDFAVFGHPEVKTTGIWVRENLRGMSDTLANKVWFGKALDAERDGDGGSTRRSSPARECFVVVGLGF